MDVVPRWRAVVVTALAICGAVCMRSWSGHLPAALWLPTGFLLAAALLVHHRHVGSLLLVRAVLWSNLLLGTVVCWYGGSSDRHVAPILALANGAALLLLGRRGLDGGAQNGRFVPMAFRGALVAILVMALADAQTLLFFGSLYFQLSGVDLRLVVPPLLIAGAFLGSVAGLYRLRVWGLALDAVASLGLLAFATTDLLRLGPMFNIVFAGSAIFQLVLVASVVVRLARGAAPAPSRLSRASVWLGMLAVAALMASAIVPVVHQYW